MFRNFLCSSLMVFAVLIVLAFCASTTVAGMISVADPLNVLSGKNVVTSELQSGHAAANVVDDLAADNSSDGPVIFAGDYQQVTDRISISGFNDGLVMVRIFTVPADTARSSFDVAIRSSTSLVTTLNAEDYEADLGTFLSSERTYEAYAPGVSANDRGYFDMVVSSPGGTQSLFLGLTRKGWTYAGSRVYEVQAFVPEPSALVLMSAASLIGLLCYAWRRRK